MKHFALVALCGVLVALAGVWLRSDGAPVLAECTCVEASGSSTAGTGPN